MSRELLRDRLAADLLGPGKPDEVLPARPSDSYLTGILYPPRTQFAEEEDEDLGGAANDADAEGEADTQADGITLMTIQRQSSAGFSFAVASSTSAAPTLSVIVRCGTYRRQWEEPGSRQLTDRDLGRKAERWTRTDHRLMLKKVLLRSGSQVIDLGNPDTGTDCEGAPIPGLHLHVQSANAGESWIVTAVLLNAQPEQEGRVEAEHASFFQVSLQVLPVAGARLVARPSRRSGEDRTAELVYRDALEYAVGHTCSAAWDVQSGTVTAVQTTWLPEQIVPAVSADGDPAFAPLRAHPSLRPLSASWLASAPTPELGSALNLLPDAYEAWLKEQENRISSLATARFRDTASDHIRACRLVSERIRSAIALLGDPDHPTVRRAFQLANRAMVLQRQWARGDADLVWRPFQLGFQLLTLASLADRKHADRRIMDLLWFPTGGGKTEAYLGLIAFTLFHRRLASDTPDDGAGVAVLMRYTLRLLTIQQFQRAATLICACEHLRRTQKLGLGTVPFSIGLWVGSAATPNLIREAAEKLHPGSGDPTPRQLVTCPVCRQKSLAWYCIHRCHACGVEGELDGIRCRACKAQPTAQKRHTPREIHVRCTNDKCPYVLGGNPGLPVQTVDEDVYRERPSLLLGTIDKFAQLARKLEEVRRFFGGKDEEPPPPPDLIIQDELHLISGPLGTVAALYEIAINELCSRTTDGVKLHPKVIGSTATIRAAHDQILALFDRGTCLFPSPVLDADDSCFACRDTEKPGRLYVGLTTAGRSPKFSLQAVYASLLQSASSPSMTDDQRDPYWTLISYFNSLRELGGALVMTQDDVPSAMVEYARRHGETRREVRAVDELTSRKQSTEIPEMLDALEHRVGDKGGFDAVLASNMISVGVDIPRLGLMVVNGQPKQVAEYIQATSRVGREHPGLVVGVFNNARARDRSYYETFSTWHRTLYRDVEPSSVTPFAARAVDKALHAALVVLARQLVYGLGTAPRLTSARRTEVESIVVGLIIDRLRRIDRDEEGRVRAHLKLLLDRWEMRMGPWDGTWNDTKRCPGYWIEEHPDRSLLMSAEGYVTLLAAGTMLGEVWPTPNSMRGVEPGTPFKLLETLKKQEKS
jgi:hypothetical protein